jgi:hypothetical protein
MFEPQKSQASASSDLLDYIQYLNRLNGQGPQASFSDSSAPAVTPSSDDLNSPGGLAGRIAALAGLNAQNPDQPAPRPGGLLGLMLEHLCTTGGI